ncbi:MAG: HAD family hydrolase [Phycisphaerae bacterium]|nr:HAD family hydrolase [Phycisphaerae bacterium]MDP7636295.1 HAD family hydrolase [Phycisphaerae bacterium]
MNRAVFLDRDHTLIEDPGYLSDPDAVKLLPGVELAIKSLHQAGYKIVVCTNQSAIARGILTEESLEKIHAEMRRQLADKGAHLDAIYYCPYHPEGTVDKYAMQSDLRKPKPGMLLKGAKEHDIDLSQSWMVGDSPRDIEAGHRAGCRTIRMRLGGEVSSAEGADEDVQADFTVRNLVDAARIVLRETDRTATWDSARPTAAVATAPAASEVQPDCARAQEGDPRAGPVSMSDSQVRMEILSHLRRLVRRGEHEEFSFLKLAGGIVQMLALLTLLIAVLKVLASHPRLNDAIFWALIAIALQVMSLTFFSIHRNK